MYLQSMLCQLTTALEFDLGNRRIKKRRVVVVCLLLLIEGAFLDWIFFLNNGFSFRIVTEKATKSHRVIKIVETAINSCN